MKQCGPITASSLSCYSLVLFLVLLEGSTVDVEQIQSALLQIKVVLY